MMNLMNLSCEMWTIMVGEKASDHILGKDPMPRVNETAWIHPQWETQQR